jgi:hypothetical protein
MRLKLRCCQTTRLPKVCSKLSHGATTQSATHATGVPLLLTRQRALRLMWIPARTPLQTWTFRSKTSQSKMCGLLIVPLTLLTYLQKSEFCCGEKENSSSCSNKVRNGKTKVSRARETLLWIPLLTNPLLSTPTTNSKHLRSSTNNYSSRVWTAPSQTKSFKMITFIECSTS